MKYIFAIIISIAFLFNVCYGDEKLELKDQRGKESYSLGYQFGQNLKKQGVDINLEVYTAGIRDALAEKEPPISSEEIQTTIKNLQQRIAAAQQEEQKKMAEKNLAEGKKFLEENAKKEGVKTLPSGLQYKVIKEGSGRTPKATDTVTVHYLGTLIDGTEFDSSYSRSEPANFQADRVIAGWKEALQLMKEGAKWQIFIPPDLAYGKRSAGHIGPNSTLIFEVELLSIGNGSDPKATEQKPAIGAPATEPASGKDGPK